MENKTVVKHVCVKCGHTFEGHFCPNCGLEVKTGKMKASDFLRETFNSLDIDRGFFKSCIVLLTHPGKIIRRYLTESRHVLYGPVKMALILGAIDTLLLLRYHIFTSAEGGVHFSGLSLPDLQGYFYYSDKYFSFFSFTSIPLFTLASWLSFKSSRYTLVENLILNLYILAGQFLINLLYFAFYLVFNSGNNDVIGILNSGYNIWVLATFFPGKPIPRMTKSTLAVLVPQIAMFFVNYLIYRITPASAWEMLDLI